jgi:hypothetical protein
MKGYILFGFDKQEQYGGAADLITMFENIEDINLTGRYLYYDTIQLFDMHKGKTKSCNFKKVIKEYEDQQGKINSEETFYKLMIDFIKKGDI